MFVLVIMITGALIASYIASGKQRSVLGWAALGALFPLIAILIVASLPSVAKPSLLDDGPR